MSIRREKDPMGMGGRAWYVSTPADLARLPSSAVAIVPAAVAAIFREAPGSISRLAERAPLGSMRRWLESLARVPCELEVYATEFFGDEARLRFRVATDFAPSFRGTTAPPSARVPEIVANVHSVTGHIDTQYGCSGTLVAMDRLQTLEDLVATQSLLNAEEIAHALRARPELRAFVGVYECDGDYLCTDPSGRAVWAGGEWLDRSLAEASTDIEAMLDRFFAALVERRHFRPTIDDD